MVHWTCIPMAKKRDLVKLQWRNRCGRWWPRNKKGCKSQYSTTSESCTWECWKTSLELVGTEKYHSISTDLPKKIAFKGAQIEKHAWNESKLWHCTTLCTDSVQMAESVIIKTSQKWDFSNEMKILDEKGILNKKSGIYRLDLYWDRCGLLRVGGRIQKSTVSEEMKHPVLLARKSEIAVMIIRWCHEKVAHSGRDITVNYIRSSGFSIINCNAAVTSYISKCGTCIHLRENFQQQKMVSLPSNRLCEKSPFNYCSVHLLGPFVNKEGRKELKRVMELCSRAYPAEPAEHWNSSFTKYRLIHFVLTQICWSLGKHQTSKIR